MCSYSASDYVKNLCVSIGKKQILSDISFPIDGGITGIIGKNGAGKTTLLKALAGIGAKPSGEIVLSGKAESKGICTKPVLFAYVPQKGVTDLHITGLEFALLGRASYLGILENPSEKDRLLAEKAFERLNASHLAQRYFDTLSGGEKKLCYLAKAICTGLDTALLDEPCANLDFGKQNEFMELLKSGLFKKVLISIHSPDLALRYCDRIIVIDGGKMLDIIDMDGSENSFLRYLAALRKLYGEKVDFAANGKEKSIIWTA